MATTVIDVAQAQRSIDELLGDRYRVEVIDGALVVTPGAGWSHNTLVGDLYLWLRTCAPDPLQVVAEQDVSADATGRSREPYWRPDIVVSAGPADPEREWLVAREVELAVEVVSPSNVAEAGSAHAYLSRRANHGARHGLRWLLGVDGDVVTWWDQGAPADAGPSWAARLGVEGGRMTAGSG